MLVLKDRILNVPVMSLEVGSEIARTDRPIIDPRYLRIHAFYCHGPRLDNNPSVLHVEDIREFSEFGFIVDNAMNLMSPEDLVRLKEIIGFNFILDNKLVVDDHNHKLGHVANYIVDSNTFNVMQLNVTPKFWQSIGTTELQISRQQIVEITDKEIIVRAPSVKAEEKALTTSRPIVENPFRRPHAHPQPETVTTNED